MKFVDLKPIHVPFSNDLEAYFFSSSFELFFQSTAIGHTRSRARAYALGGGLGLTPPLELDILRKLYYLHKGD